MIGKVLATYRAFSQGVKKLFRYPTFPVLEQRIQHSTMDEGLQTFLALSRIGVTIVDVRKGEFLKVSDCYQKITGYSEEELRNKRFFDLLHPEERAATLKSFDAALLRGDSYWNNEVRYTRKDGTSLWVRINGSLLKENHEEPSRFFAVVQDIDQEVLAKEESQRLQAMLSLIINSVPVLLSYVGTDFRYKFANRAYELAYGIPCVAGIHLSHLLSPETFQRMKPYAERALRGEKVQFDLDVQFPITGNRSLQCTYIPDINHEQRVNGFVALIVDLTERVQVETELVRLKAHADEAMEERSAFLAQLSHELRTPLNAITGFAKLLAAEEQYPGERLKYLDIIQRNEEHLQRLIKDILDLSKTQSKKLELIYEKMKLSDFLDELKVVFTQEAEKKNLRFLLSIVEPLPSILITDGVRLRQILTNVIGNAIKFTDEGAVQLQVKRGNEPGRLSFFVKDSGCGIPTKKLPFLFKPFSQLHLEKRKYEGSGIGLCLSKTLAELLGGDLVLVESEAGKGSLFHLTIEEVALPPLEEPKRIVVESFGRFQKPLRGLHILVAEDTQDNWDLLCELLTMSGAKAERATTGEEAAQMANLREYDLILMDLSMPEMDGFEAVKEIRRKGYAKPIIALSGRTTIQEIELARAAGCNDHLAKPVEHEVLMERILTYTQQ